MNVVLILTGLNNFIANTSANVQKVLKQWTFIYLSFIQMRFVQQGNGEWPPLSPVTIARRRKGKGSGSIAILRDTGTLFRALDPVMDAPGGLKQYNIPNFSVLIGYGGPSAHPNGPATISDIATFHQFGMGHNPIRRIIVEPDPSTHDRLVQAAETIFQQDANNTI